MVYSFPMLKHLRTESVTKQLVVLITKQYTHKKATMDSMLEKVRSIIPPLSVSQHKGQAGRIGIVGGSIEYTGAPYFAAISALKAGCDLAHVFCMKDAAVVIKSYSPELIVHPVLDAGTSIDKISQWLPNMHALVIGPGLGREQSIFTIISQLFDRIKELNIPVVVDADGLFFLSQNPEKIRNYTKAILTPNAVEFSRLVKGVSGKELKPSPLPNPEDVKELAKQLGNVTIVHKGAADVVTNGEEVVVCEGGGSPRRCGGQGDLLSGSLGTFYCWSLLAADKGALSGSPAVCAAYGACRLTRECNKLGFEKHGRSTTTSDMIDVIHQAFSSLYGL